jgi:hypothetical protein
MHGVPGNTAWGTVPETHNWFSVVWKVQTSPASCNSQDTIVSRHGAPHTNLPAAQASVAWQSTNGLLAHSVRHEERSDTSIKRDIII